MKYNAIYFWSGCFLLLLVAIFIQARLQTHGDVSYLLYTAEQLFSGKSYGKEIFETNPPMILYLYAPAIFLAKWSSISALIWVQLYIFTLSLISFGLCYRLSSKIFSNTNVHYIFMGGVLFTLLLLPVDQFGQREHLFIIFLLPYLLASACILQQKNLHPLLLSTISLAAGLVFCLKPYFIFIFIFLNGYIAWTEKSIWRCICLPSMIISLIMIVYLTSTYVLFPGYFDVVLPLVNQFYFKGIRQSWIMIATNSLFLMNVASLMTYFIFRKQDRYPMLGDILALALLGAMLAYLIPRAPWFYHVIPALVLSFLLLLHYIGQFICSLTYHSTVERILVSGMILLLLSPMLLMINEESKRGIAPLDLQTVAAFLSVSPGDRSLTCFSMTTTEDCFPLVQHLHARYASRYPFFWWLRGLHDAKDQAKFNYFMETIADDFETFKPHWVLVNDLPVRFFFGPSVSFLQFFAKSVRFNQAWRPYSLRMSVGDYQLYERRNERAN